MNGRTVIYSDVEAIDRDNVIEVLTKAMNVHSTNVIAMEKLIAYYRGEMDIYQRTKEVRPDINYKVVENRCKEIVDFKVGFSIGDPIQYNDRTGENQEAINELNSIMDYEGRNDLDEEVVEKTFICGTAYKYAFPKDEPDEISNIEIGFMDPLQTFVIYSSGFRREPLAGVWFVKNSENNTYHYVYTKEKTFKIENQETIVEESINGYGEIPIVEYPCNNSRIGAFESVTDLQDALNDVDSDRLNAIAQFVQSLIVTTNCNFEEDTTASDIMHAGILRLTSSDGVSQDVKILTQELNQEQTQTYKDDIYQSMLTICAMPNRNGGSSTSDTGLAVVYRDGWTAAETWEKRFEVVYKRSEKAFLKLCCAIFDAVGGPNIKYTDIAVQFTRSNYVGISQKVDILDKALKNDKIAPRLGFILSGAFPDPEEAYAESLPYIEKAMAQANADINREVQTQETETS